MKSYYVFNSVTQMAAILPFTDKTMKFPSKPELFDLSLTFYELMFLNHSYIRIGGQGYVDGVPEKLFKNHAAVTKIVYNKYLKKIERPEHLSTYFIMPIPLVYAHNELEEYIKGTMSNIVQEIGQIKVNFDFQAQFSNKQLISYIFKKNTLNFVTDIPSISREKPHEDLQIIEIAVDAGTSKGFIEATLTELIQNSMDAIRITEAKNRSVSITTGTIVDFDDYCFCSIQDYVGMDMTNLQAISIPFYSNKTASEIATGEMGTGFFNVYRESVMVIIDTVKDGHRILVEDRPVRKNGRIQDIDKRVTESKTNDPNSTKITFVVKRDSHADVMSFLSVTSYLVHSVFAYMNFSDVILNGTSVKKSKRLIYRLDELECYRTDQGTKSYIFTKGVPFSVLFEYFQPILADLGISREQLEFMDTNLIINIRHGFYTPVQSRTKLNISPMNLAKLKTFLKNCLFYALLEYLYTASVYYDNIPNVVKQVQEQELLLDEKTRERTQRLHQLAALGDTATSEQRASYLQLWNEVVSIRKHKDKLVEQSLPVRVAYPVIENMTQLNLFNKVEIDQVIPKLAPGYVPGDSLTDILFYTQTLFKVPTTSNGRMVDHLHSFCGSSWIRDKQLYPEWKIEYRKYVERILKDVPDLDTRIIGDKFFKIIETWISTKAPPSDGKLEVKVQSGYDESKIINLVQPATIIFQKFVDTFLNLANEYGLDEYPKKLNVRFQLDQPGTLAYFSKNEIVVNTYNVNPLHLAIFIQNVPKYKQSIELVRDNLLYRSYFGVSYPASTIPHELEHARRNQKHDQGGVHDDVEVAILGKEKKRYNYDEATNEFLLFLSSKGFVEKFIAAL